MVKNQDVSMSNEVEIKCESERGRIETSMPSETKNVNGRLSLKVRSGIETCTRPQRAAMLMAQDTALYRGSKLLTGEEGYAVDTSSVAYSTTSMVDIVLKRKRLCARKSRMQTHGSRNSLIED